MTRRDIQPGIELRGILCARCHHGTVFRQRGADEPTAYCGADGPGGQQVPLDIVECTSYLDRQQVLERVTASARLFGQAITPGGNPVTGVPPSNNPGNP